MGKTYEEIRAELEAEGRRNLRQPAERIADALESLAKSPLNTMPTSERIANALESLVKIGEALGQIAEEALWRIKSPGGFRATATGEGAEAELVEQDDADLARMEQEDARRDLTGREQSLVDNYNEEDR